MQDRARANEKISFRWNSVVDELKGEATLEGVVLRDVLTDERTELPVTGVFVAIGHKPNTDLFKGQLDMEDNGYLVTRPGSTYTNVEACSPAATCRTTPTARPSPRPDRAAWRPSTPSAGSRPRHD